MTGLLDDLSIPVHLLRAWRRFSQTQPAGRSALNLMHVEAGCILRFPSLDRAFESADIPSLILQPKDRFPKIDPARFA